MFDIQESLFRWAGAQGQGTAVVIVALGLLCALQGFRFARFLFAITCGAAGFFAGGAVAAAIGAPAPPAALLCGAVLGGIGMYRFAIGACMSSMFVFALVAGNLAARFTADPNSILFGMGVGALFGLSLRWVSVRAMPIIVTTVAGAGLLIVGFVGLTGSLAPSLAQTFVDWSQTIPLLTPAMMVMLFVLGYSVQANAQQGDIQTGGSQNISRVEAG